MTGATSASFSPTTLPFGNAVRDDHPLVARVPLPFSPAAAMSLSPNSQSGDEQTPGSTGRTRRRIRRSSFPPAWVQTRRGRLGIATGTLLLLAVLVWRLAIPAVASPVEVPFSTVAAAIAAGELTVIDVHGGGSKIVARVANPSVGGAAQVSTRVPGAGVALSDLERWAASGITV